MTTVNLYNRTSEATFIEELKVSEDEADMFAGSSIYWGSYHPTIDKHLETTEDDYAVYCSIMSGSKTNPALSQTDGEIVRQTNLLSLNASIEAARELSCSEEKLNHHMRELEEAISSFHIN